MTDQITGNSVIPTDFLGILVQISPMNLSGIEGAPPWLGSLFKRILEFRGRLP